MGSKKPHSTRPRRAVRSLQHKPRRPIATTLRDFQAIFTALGDGLSLVQAAHMALRYADQWGPAEVALREGVKALQVVRSDLDAATTELHRSHRKVAGVRK